MKRFYSVLLLAAGLLCAVSVCFSPAGAAPGSSTWDSLTSFFTNGELDNLVAVSVGYDDNVWLDSRRIGDGFFQLYYRPKLVSSVNDRTDGILSYELLDITYFGEPSANLVRNAFNAGFEHSVNKNVDFLANYRLGISDYINSGPDDFVDNSIELKLKQKLPRKMFHSLMHEFMFKDYQQRKTRNVVGTETNDKREDRRYTLEYEIGKYFPKDLLRGTLQYYFNSSNEGFLKYYDHTAWKPGVALTHLFSKKVFGNASFAYEWRSFRSRTLILAPSVKQRDKTGSGMVGLYYTPKKDLTVGVSYTYRQNYSNEPTERYSGSILSINTYYHF